MGRPGRRGGVVGHVCGRYRLPVGSRDVAETLAAFWARSSLGPFTLEFARFCVESDAYSGGNGLLIIYTVCGVLAELRGVQRGAYVCVSFRLRVSVCVVCT